MKQTTTESTVRKPRIKKKVTAATTVDITKNRVCANKCYNCPVSFIRNLFNSFINKFKKAL